jgi:hypothetical protein
LGSYPISLAVAMIWFLVFKLMVPAPVRALDTVGGEKPVRFEISYMVTMTDPVIFDAFQMQDIKAFL